MAWIRITAGHTAVVSASLIFIPLTILIAVCVPGNQVLPLAICHYRLLRDDGGRGASWKSVPHLNLGCHHYEYHPVNSDANYWFAHPTGG
ncbi:hypothetical protein ACNKHU_12760 [Shigella flexneri]